MQRGYDNIIHDIALQNLPVTICVDRAGLNAADGATHHGLFDAAFLSGVPNMTVYTPVTERALKKALAEKKAEQKAADAEYDNAVKENILKFKRYRNRVDLLNALLEDNKAYTIDEVDALIDEFMKGKVK